MATQNPQNRRTNSFSVRSAGSVLYLVLTSPVALDIFSKKESLMNVRPLRDRILVKRIAETEQRIGGNIHSHNAKEKAQAAHGVAAGNGRFHDQRTGSPLL